MGRKDVTRFIKIENRIRMLEINQDKLIEAKDKIDKDWKNSIILLRELVDKLIEAA